jgi:hypothetical protein
MKANARQGKDVFLPLSKAWHFFKKSFRNIYSHDNIHHEQGNNQAAYMMKETSKPWGSRG